MNDIVLREKSTDWDAVVGICSNISSNKKNGKSKWEVWPVDGGLGDEEGEEGAGQQVPHLREDGVALLLAAVEEGQRVGVVVGRQLHETRRRRLVQRRRVHPVPLPAESINKKKNNNNNQHQMVRWLWLAHAQHRRLMLASFLLCWSS